MVAGVARRSDGCGRLLFGCRVAANSNIDLGRLSDLALAAAARAGSGGRIALGGSVAFLGGSLLRNVLLRK